MSTIIRKPKAGKGAAAPQEEKIKAVIFKGMSTPGDNTASPLEEETEQQVKLRLPLVLLKRIDAAVKAEPIKTSRHRWLMEAIVEKLEKSL